MRALPRYLLLSLALLALALALDALSTYLALNSGYANEGNPLLASLFQTPLGLLLFIVFKLFALFLAFYIARLLVSRHYRWRLYAFAALLVTCAFIFFLVSASNLFLAFRPHDLLSPPSILLFLVK